MMKHNLLNAFTLTTGCFFSLAAHTQSAIQENQPNIIYILADDLGYGDLSCYGQQHFETPNIDRLAAEGIRFTQHYAGSALSAPSRCSLMTGKHTGHSRIRGNFSASNKRINLTEDDVTIPELLKKAGYSTGMFGKWGLGELGTVGTPNKKGFDEFFGYVNQKHAHFYYYPTLQYNEKQYEVKGNQKDSRGQYNHDLIHSKAKEYITNQAKNGAPFFAYLAYTLPHSELDVPEDDLKKFLGKFDETPFLGSESKGYKPQPTPFAAFCAMITRLDRHVGEIMSLVKELEIDDNTLIIFTSDNGPHKEGGADPMFFNSNGSMRGIKRDLYDGGIREPMIVRWKNTISEGQTTDAVTAFWDVMPTLCDIAHIETPKDIDGISFLPVLKGKELPAREYLYWELGEKTSFKQAVRMGDYKAVRYGLKNKIEIYDIVEDKSESTDLSNTRQDLVQKAMKIFAEAHMEDPNFPMKDYVKKNKSHNK